MHNSYTENIDVIKETIERKFHGKLLDHNIIFTDPKYQKNIKMIVEKNEGQFSIYFTEPVVEIVKEIGAESILMAKTDYDQLILIPGVDPDIKNTRPFKISTKLDYLNIENIYRWEDQIAIKFFTMDNNGKQRKRLKLYIGKWDPKSEWLFFEPKTPKQHSKKPKED